MGKVKGREWQEERRGGSGRKRDKEVKGERYRKGEKGREWAAP